MENKEKTVATQATPAPSETGSVIGWLERILKLKKDYGLGGILTAIMLLFITITVGTLAFKPDVFINQVQKIQARQHQEAVDKRIQADPQIREALLDLRQSLNADRVFIVEAHNGGTNLSNLPFLYVDMTYENVRPGMPLLEEEYKNVRLQRYGFCTFLFNNNFWSGTLEELNEVDQTFSLRLQGDEVNHFSMMALYGQYTITGAIGVEYCKSEPMSKEYIMVTMQKAANKFAILLNNELKY